MKYLQCEWCDINVTKSEQISTSHKDPAHPFTAYVAEIELDIAS